MITDYWHDHACEAERINQSQLNPLVTTNQVQQQKSGLMVCAPDFSASRPCSSPGRGTALCS